MNEVLVNERKRLLLNMVVKKVNTTNEVPDSATINSATAPSQLTKINSGKEKPVKKGH